MREAVLDEARAYVWRSRYHAQLTRFLEHYPMERILLLEQDELLKDRARRSGACSASSASARTSGARPSTSRGSRPRPAGGGRRWACLPPSACR